MTDQNFTASHHDRGKWNQGAIIAALLEANEGGIVRSTRVGMTVVTMARRKFGSFQAACEAAGLTSYSNRPKVDHCTAENCGTPVRSPGAMYCEKHYMRIRRGGTTEKRKVAADRLVTTHGYIIAYRPDHPLAYSDGRVFEHRAVYYDAHGPGPFCCHWCGTSVTWETLHIDHLNDQKTDNRLSNLAATCADCNMRRGLPKMRKTMRENGVRLRLGDDERCISEWARHLGISRTALVWRLRNWSVKKALTATKGNTGPASRRISV